MRRPFCRLHALAHTGLALLIVWSAAFPLHAAEDQLGRLFFTPAERQEADRQRQQMPQDEIFEQEMPTFTLNGIVKRSSGKNTVWINDQAYPSPAPPPGPAMRPRPPFPRTQPKVGDSWHADSDATISRLPRGSIVRHPPGRRQHSMADTP